MEWCTATRSIRVCNTTPGLASYPIPCSASVHVTVSAPLSYIITSTTRWVVNGYVLHSLTHSFHLFILVRSLLHKTLKTEHAQQLRTRCLWRVPRRWCVCLFSPSFCFFWHSGESFRLPMGVYGTSTFHQGTPPTPVAHPAPSSSNCCTFPSITAGLVRAKRSLEKKFAPAFPKQTPPP